MGLTSRSTPKKQQPIPPMGMQLGMCYSIIDLGTQETTFPGKPTSWEPKLQISWELPAHSAVFDPQKGPQLMTVHNEYPVKAGEKAKLAKVLCAWGNIDIKLLKNITPDLLKRYLGAPCTLRVIHVPSKSATDESTGQPLVKAYIGGNGADVMPLMEGMNRPQATQNPIKYLDLDAFDWNVYNSLPQFLQEKIAKCREWPQIIAKYPKPATTMAQDLGYTTQASAPAQQQYAQPAMQQNQGQGFYQQPINSIPAQSQNNQLNDQGQVFAGPPAGGPSF